MSVDFVSMVIYVKDLLIATHDKHAAMKLNDMFICSFIIMLEM